MILENFERPEHGAKTAFSDTCNKLLSTGFLARDKRDNKEQYYFLLISRITSIVLRVINYEIKSIGKEEPSTCQQRIETSCVSRKTSR